MTTRFFLALIRAYQWMTRPLYRLLPRICRFEPSCSEYTAQALMQYGTPQGLWLGLKRICRCHPLNPGGWDPVPKQPH